jgi:aldose 1-epimerase
MIIEYEPFGKSKNNISVGCYTLQNNNGLKAKISDYGGTWLSMFVPDKNSEFADVILGFDGVDGYEENPYISCITGPYANRIANGRFSLDGKTYQLEINDPPNHLHGGSQQGLDKCLWLIEREESNNRLVLKYTSVDGEAGYPGNLILEVSYQLTDKNEFVIRYHATTDEATPVNLTNHAYFNLGASNNILDHYLQLDADLYTPVDSGNIPLGENISPPEALDFRRSKALGTAIHGLSRAALADQFVGIDHNFVFNNYDGALRKQGKLFDPGSGRSMTVHTSEPGVQVYTGQHFRDVQGKNGWSYSAYAGICLETQHFPDSPNRANFPTTILRPEKVFESTTLYHFEV